MVRWDTLSSMLFNQLIIVIITFLLLLSLYNALFLMTDLIAVRPNKEEIQEHKRNNIQ